MVDDSCGVRIHPEKPDQFAAAIAAAVRELVGDPERRIRMGAAARERVASVALWPNKVARMEAIYADLLTGSG